MARANCFLVILLLTLHSLDANPLLKDILKTLQPEKPISVAKLGKSSRPSPSYQAQEEPYVAQSQSNTPNVATDCRTFVFEEADTLGKCDRVVRLEDGQFVIAEGPPPISALCRFQVIAIDASDNVEGNCLCPVVESSRCNDRPECYWHRDPGYESQGECISNAERFYNILNRLLVVRGKKDFAFRVQYKAAPAPGALPYGPNGPAYIGLNTPYFQFPYLANRYSYPSNPYSATSGQYGSYGGLGYPTNPYLNFGSYGMSSYPSGPYGNTGSTYGTPGYPAGDSYGVPGYPNGQYGNNYGSQSYQTPSYPTAGAYGAPNYPATSYPTAGSYGAQSYPTTPYTATGSSYGTQNYPSGTYPTSDYGASSYQAGSSGTGANYGATQVYPSSSYPKASDNYGQASNYATPSSYPSGGSASTYPASPSQMYTPAKPSY